MKLTKKLVKENLVEKNPPSIEEIWTDLKKENLAGKHMSIARKNLLYERYVFVLKDSFFK